MYVEARYIRLRLTEYAPSVFGLSHDNMTTKTRMVIVPDDGMREYTVELAYLFQIIGAGTEIREGYYSDESNLRDLFDMFATRKEMAAQLDSPDLPLLTVEMPLLEALSAIRRFRIRH